MPATSSPKVRLPVMYHHWSRMTFLHWRYSPAVVQALVPDSLTVETFDGSAWVALTPFLMEGVRAPGLPILPWLSCFPETNVRTYVRDERGRSGIWFLSLDAGRLPAALGGRSSYWLPYHWSDMSVRTDDELVRYRCRRTWPGPRGARCDADVRAGAELPEGDELAAFLTARFRLFTRVAGRLASAEVEHPPWPLRGAEVVSLEQNLVQAGGLPEPESDPLPLFSSGVPVRVGPWTW